MVYALLPNTMVVKKVPRGNVTSERLWKAYTWSLEACSTGVHPSVDMDGNEWPVDHARRLLAGAYLADGERLLHIRTTGDMGNYEKE